MTYSMKVKFSSTGNYGCGPKGEDDVYTVEEFKDYCECGAFIDYDGFGYPVKDGMADTDIEVYPSICKDIPKDATHIVWYNR